MYFHPRLTLVPTPGDTYTLIARTQVPDTCYIAGACKAGAPPGVVTIPETDPFTFEIKHVLGIFCGHIVHDVVQQMDNIKISTGKSSVTVFIVIDGKVEGSASLPVHAPALLAAAQKARPASSGVYIVPDTLHAYANEMPPGPFKLRVSASVITPTPGYTLKLEPLKPQGINPRDLLLGLVVTPPTKPVPQHVVTQTVRYEEPWQNNKYSHVTVINGQQVLTVPVQIVL